MAQTSHRSRRSPYQKSLRRYVTSPIETGIKRVHQEKVEVSAEREAFKAFIDRVSDLAPVKNVSISNPHKPIANQSNHAKQIREAYRDTVMSTEHYDSEYGDSYLESIQGEFGGNAAAALNPQNPVPFTRIVKQRVLTAANRCAKARSDLLEHVQAESTSLSQAREELTDILDRRDTGQFPVQRESHLMSRLEDLAAVRQNTLQQHSVHYSMDKVDFCEFLYTQEPWTFPVLVGISRLRQVAVE